MENQSSILDAQLENRVSIIEEKLERLGGLVASFAISLESRDVKLAAGFAKIRQELGLSMDSDSKSALESSISGLECSRSNELIKFEEVVSDFDFAHNLQMQEAFNMSVPIYPYASQSNSVDRIEVLMEGAKKQQEFKKLQVNEILDLNVASEEELLDFNEKQGLMDGVLKLFVEMPKQEMCEVLLDRVSFYGINEFPFDPGIPTADHEYEYMAGDLLINECHSIAFMFILLGLKKLQHLEVLSIGGIPTVYDDFVRKYIIDCGYSWKEICLNDEASVAIDEIVYCPHIRCFVLRPKDEVLEYTRHWGVGVESFGCV